MVASPVVRRWIARVALALGLVLALLGVDRIAAGMDREADDYFDRAMTTAALSYATTRTINAVVSVMKDTELGATPVGIGVNVGVGQILDPLDDMTERASDVLVLAIASLGLQKILHELGGGLTLWIPAVAAGALLLLCYARPAVVHRVAAKALSVVAVLVLIRLLMPVSGLIHGSIYDHYFQPRIEDASARLEVVPLERLEALATFDFPRVDGPVDAVEKGSGFIAVKAALVRSIFAEMIDKAVPLVEALLDLAVAYLGLLILQVLIIPVGIMFTAYWVFKWVMAQRVDQWLQGSPAPVAADPAPRVPNEEADDAEKH